jgi:hypothetical protein
MVSLASASTSRSFTYKYRVCNLSPTNTELAIFHLQKKYRVCNLSPTNTEFAIFHLQIQSLQSLTYNYRVEILFSPPVISVADPDRKFAAKFFVNDLRTFSKCSILRICDLRTMYFCDLRICDLRTNYLNFRKYIIFLLTTKSFKCFHSNLRTTYGF